MKISAGFATTLRMCLLCAALFVAINATDHLRGYSAKPDYADEQNVSLMQLVAQPEKYDGKRVQFIGFLRLEFEGTATYLHREDFDQAIAGNAVWVNVPSAMTKKQQDETNMHYVVCVGVFHANRHGLMDMFSGEITDIQRLQTWPGRPDSRLQQSSPK